MRTNHFAKWIAFGADALLVMLSATASAQPAFPQIEIAVPGGKHGMQPALALTYVPGSGNGMLGMGWQLSALKSRPPSRPQHSPGRALRACASISWRIRREMRKVIALT